MQVEYVSDPVSAPIDIPEESPSPEQIRRAHIRAESSIKAIGLLLLLSVAVSALGLFRSLGQVAQGPAGVPAILTSVGWLIGTGISGMWLHALDPRGRRLFTVLCLVYIATLAFQAPGMLDELSNAAAAMTTTQASFQRAYYMLLAMGLSPLLVRAAIMYILWNRKGRMVMSRHYRQAIIPATPQIQCRSRLFFFLALAGWTLLIAALVALAVMSA